MEHSVLSAHLIQSPDVWPPVLPTPSPLVWPETQPSIAVPPLMPGLLEELPQEQHVQKPLTEDQQHCGAFDMLRTVPRLTHGGRHSIWCHIPIRQRGRELHIDFGENECDENTESNDGVMHQMNSLNVHEELIRRGVDLTGALQGSLAFLWPY